MDDEAYAQWTDERVRDVSERILRHTAVWWAHEEDKVPQEREVHRIGGSGVLVRGEGWQGVLTAAHCIARESNVQAPDGRSVSTLGGGGRNGQKMPGFLVAREMLAQSVVAWEPKNKHNGPDIAFTPLPECVMNELESRTEGVFLNLERTERLASLNDAEGMLQIVGHVAVDGEAVKLHYGMTEGLTQVVTRLEQRQTRAGEETSYTRNGWGLMRLEPVPASETSRLVDIAYDTDEFLRELTTSEPGTWGGMSGGGVWWTGRPKDGTGAEELVAVLVGIVFWERTEGGQKIVYAHDRSAVDQMVAKVKAAGLRYRENLMRVKPVMRR